MGEDLWFDVYGRFLLLLRPGGDGWWLVYRLRPEGRREAIDEFVIPMDATDTEIFQSIEAAYHELARPGTDLTWIDPLPT